jgi:hypothetical protein
MRVVVVYQARTGIKIKQKEIWKEDYRERIDRKEWLMVRQWRGTLERVKRARRGEVVRREREVDVEAKAREEKPFENGADGEKEKKRWVRLSRERDSQGRNEMRWDEMRSSEWVRYPGVELWGRNGKQTGGPGQIALMLERM